MKKKISVIIINKSSQLGKEGHIIKVAPGYAFNYLIPNQLATLASSKSIKHIAMFKEINKKRDEINLLKGEQLQQYLKNINKIQIYKKIGDNYTFFGSINEKEIIKNLTKYTGQVFEKKHLEISQIKQIGTHQLKINILNTFECKLKIHVIPENI
uniref:50S ribosomal protein L9, chloroplastic n=1 Tax=Spermothamnion repens TaxID=31383 RepID=A0A4D6WYR5_9FLOR|nr:ribosomal protein L9 [Spermothamnion repens]